MVKYKIIILLMLIFTMSVFAQVPFYHQFSEQLGSQYSNNGNYSPYSYKLIGAGSLDIDTVEIYAIRIEFKPDSVVNTTGNGLFMRADAAAQKKAVESTGVNAELSRKDIKEFEWYRSGIYKYDRIPHDSIYFEDHLTSLSNYYRDVSNGKIKIGWKIFPEGNFGSFRLNSELVYFSPGQKRRDETYDEFDMRVGRAFMRFVSQAVAHAANDKTRNPFVDLEQDEDGRIFRYDENLGKNIPVFVLVIHAGVSAITDGGDGGAGNADSPNDLTDAFIGEDMFRVFNLPGENVFDAGFVMKDPATGKTGMQISGKSGKFTLSELMMVSSSANQDSLNWGINGILVNQFARQIGIPDLFSTWSNISGIGRFGIMDFAGYMSGQGFVPPNPSAFVRSYMGWDKPLHAKVGDIARIKALLRKDNGIKNDSTLFLVPINSKEYYLVENRQRNLTDNNELFTYDTINDNGTKKIYISSWLNINLDNNVLTDGSRRSVVMKVRSRDIGIPASGVCVWHIDENLIENRISQNFINTDSSYRAVNLLEADGITDIGVEFIDMLGYSQWDYGGAADVFPHKNIFKNGEEITNKISPTTAPATIANDGGNTFLSLEFVNTNTRGNKEEKYYFAKGQNENSKFNEYEVVNISDTIIKMSIGLERENISPVDGFPKKLSGGGGFFPFLTADVLMNSNGTQNEIVMLSKDGYLSILDVTGDLIFGEKTDAVNMPAMVGNSLFVPCKNKIMVYNGETGSIEKSEIPDINISSNIVGMGEKSWVAGTKNGEIIFGDKKIKLDASEINAIAKYNENSVVAISRDGVYALIDKNGNVTEKATVPNAKIAFPPFKIAVFDGKIAISDGKNGLWISGSENGRSFPIDWAGVFSEDTARSGILHNEGYISAEDLTGDGTLNIILGGTNGIYAFDNKGNLLANYPAVLDRAFWWIRESVQATPITARDADGEKFVFFPTMTGDNKSYYQTKITGEDRERGFVFFENIHGRIDSLGGYSAAEIDTLLTMGDSVIIPYFAPGGLIDVRLGKTGKRPDETAKTSNAGNKRTFPYLISIGSPVSQGVVLDDIDKNGMLDLLAVSDDAMIYRFELPKNKFPANQTNMVGGNAQRQFNFTAVGGTQKPVAESLEYFYSYPNPVRVEKNGKASVNFRYELGDDASSAMLTIYTVQGQKVFEEKNLPMTRGVNEFVVNDFSRFGSAVYRCRLSVKFGAKEKVLFWKMAVLR